MLVSRSKIKKALRFAGTCTLLYMAVSANAQSKEALEGEVTTYVSIHSAKDISALGVATIYNKKNFCQMRYNYEDTRTFSFFWGRPIVHEKKCFLQVVPTIGLSVGNFMGVSPSLQLFTEGKQFEFYSSNQTSICFTNLNRSFFFSWSEALYKFKNTVKLGAAVQYLKQYPSVVRTRETELPAIPQPQQQLDVGVVAGVQYWRFYLSGYFFNLWTDKRHYAVNLTYNFR